MENKKKEKIIEESVEKIEVRDFSLVWDDIKDTVIPPKRKLTLNLRFVATAIATLVVISSAIIPLSINYSSGGGGALQSGELNHSTSDEKVYFVDELSLVNVESGEFFNQLLIAGINIVDIGRYSTAITILLQAVNQEVKGGQVELIDDLENPSFLVFLTFYDKSDRKSVV